MPMTVHRCFVAACLFCLLFALSADAEPKKDELQGRLLQAIGSGDIADVRTLLDRGARSDEPFDQYGLTPIMLAETVEMAALLCEYGADVTARDVGGGTVVHYAVTRDRAPALVPFFVSRGADINARGWNGDTALHVAVVHLCETRPQDRNRMYVHGAGNVQIAPSGSSSGPSPGGTGADFHTQPQAFPSEYDLARELLTMLAEQGADLDSTDGYGYTPLMVAATAGDGELVKVLLELGADKTLRNTDGRTASDLARETGEKGIFELLR